MFDGEARENGKSDGMGWENNKSDSSTSHSDWGPPAGQYFSYTSENDRTERAQQASLGVCVEMLV